MALQGAFEREIRKVKKTALAAAIKLGFEPGKGLMDAIYLEWEFWNTERGRTFWRGMRPNHSSPAVKARVRCLEAFWVTLDPLYIRDTDAIDWIKQIDRAVVVLRRDVGKAAPLPDDRALRIFKRNEQAAQAASAQIARARASEIAARAPATRRSLQSIIAAREIPA